MFWVAIPRLKQCNLNSFNTVAVVVVVVAVDAVSLSLCVSLSLFILLHFLHSAVVLVLDQLVSLFAVKTQCRRFVGFSFSKV